ncbi:hypothetical protein OE810_13270, partial [Rhodobacteraceae bacterium XHP0102]|nr:hypothetical protein [Rhodobacteraceae bacterium XHP0102]
ITDTDLDTIVEIASAITTLQGSVGTDDGEGDLFTRLDALETAVNTELENRVADLELLTAGITDTDLDTIVEIASAITTLQGSVGTDDGEGDLFTRLDALETALENVFTTILAGPGVELTVAGAPIAFTLDDRVVANYRLVDDAVEIRGISLPSTLVSNAKAVIINDNASLTSAQVTDLTARGVDWSVSSYSLTGTANDLLGLGSTVLNNATSVEATGTVNFTQANTLLGLQNSGTTTIEDLSITVDQANRMSFDTNDIVEQVTIIDAYAPFVLNLSSFPLRTDAESAKKVIFTGRADDQTAYLPTGITGDGADTYYLEVDLSTGAGNDDFIFYGGGDAGDSVVVTGEIAFADGVNTLTLVGGVDLSAVVTTSTILRFKDVQSSLTTDDTFQFTYNDSPYTATLGLIAGATATAEEVQNAVDLAVGAGLIDVSFVTEAGEDNVLFTVTDPTIPFLTKGTFTDDPGGTPAVTFGFGNVVVVAETGSASVVTISEQTVNLISGLTGDGSTVLQVVNSDPEAEPVTVDLSALTLTDVAALEVGDNAIVKLTVAQADAFNVDPARIENTTTGQIDIVGDITVAIALSFGELLAPGFTIVDTAAAIEAITDSEDLAILGKAGTITTDPLAVLDLDVAQASGLAGSGSPSKITNGYDIDDSADNILSEQSAGDTNGILSGASNIATDDPAAVS